MPPHGTTFNAETAELAELTRFLCGFREFCVDRRVRAARSDVSFIQAAARVCVIS